MYNAGGGYPPAKGIDNLATQMFFFLLMNNEAIEYISLVGLKQRH